MIDLSSEGKTLDMVGVTRLQQLKTGALIAFSCEAGPCSAVPRRMPFTRFMPLRTISASLTRSPTIFSTPRAIPARLARRLASDAAAGKATFVSILGVERARDQARMLADQAIQHLDLFDERADLLREAPRFVITRRN